MAITLNGSTGIVASNLATGAARTNFGAGAVLQVVSYTKSDTFTTTASGIIDIPGLSLSITPSSTSSKIMILGRVNVGADNASIAYHLQCYRDSTLVGAGDASGSKTRTFGGTEEGFAATGISQYQMFGYSLLHMDLPSSNSSLTYKISVNVTQQYGTFAVNRTIYDGDTSAFPRSSSTLTLMEIAG